MWLLWLVRSLLQPPPQEPPLPQPPQVPPPDLPRRVVLVGQLREEAPVEHQHLPTPDANQKTSVAAKVKKATNQTKA